MNVLFLEDRGATAYYVERWLEENGHTVLAAFNPNDANSHWRTRRETPIDCIILDLQTPMDGLTEEQRAQAEGGTLAGWVWLRDTVLAENPQVRQRVIIYSDYVSVLREKVRKDEYEGITVVGKKPRGSSADVIVARICEIARNA